MMENVGKKAIQEKYYRVMEQIDQAARSVHRGTESIKLVVVTKGHSTQTVKGAIAAGVRIFGENYAEEGIQKMRKCPEDLSLEWHMIGHVQSRKARAVCENYDWMHSLDRLKIARRLDRFCGELGRKLPVLLECNVSGERTKFGWPAWKQKNWPDLLGEFSQVVELPNLDILGLMTMAPYSQDPEQARPYFLRLRRLRDFLSKHIPQIEWRELSMGMSDDFPVAVQEGATLVRVGTAILGPRP
jgi:pyridoxal phosphate enzyme (YggS family)